MGGAEEGPLSALVFHVHVLPIFLIYKRKRSQVVLMGNQESTMAVHPVTQYSTWPAGTCPSVDAEKHSVPVFDCSQMVPYTGSRWLNSMVDSSATRLPFRVSQQAGREENEREVNTQASLPGAGSRGERGAAPLGLAGMIFRIRNFSNQPEFPTGPHKAPPRSPRGNSQSACFIHSSCPHHVVSPTPGPGEANGNRTGAVPGRQEGDLQTQLVLWLL